METWVGLSKIVQNLGVAIAALVGSFLAWRNFSPVRSQAERAPATPYRVDLHGAFMRRVDLDGASLVGANFAGADAKGASFRGADFKDANLDGTVLNGADLRDSKNLTVEQLSQAIIDEATALPDYIDRNALPKEPTSNRERS